VIFLFGEQVVEKNPETGQFYCPQCQQVRAYQHIRLKNYFTLFFIPLLPLGTPKEYLECRSCGCSFHPSALADRQQLPAYHYALRRIMADILRATRISENNLVLMSQIYQAATETEFSSTDAQAAVQAARDDPRDLLEYLRTVGRGLNTEGLEDTLLASAQLLAHLAGELPLPHDYRVIFNQIAAELGVGASGVEALLWHLQSAIKQHSD